MEGNQILTERGDIRARLHIKESGQGGYGGRLKSHFDITIYGHRLRASLLLVRTPIVPI